jgi:membrane protein DedA with SNARE-associated domain
MKNTQLFIVFALMTGTVWSGYYTIISWISGPQWRMIASMAALAGFLTLSALYIHYLLTDKPRK